MMRALFFILGCLIGLLWLWTRSPGPSTSSPGASPTPTELVGEPLQGEPLATAPVMGKRPLPPGVSMAELEKGAPPPLLRGNYQPITFTQLSAFSCTPEEVPKIPSNIQALNKKPVAVSGFMIPLGADAQGVTEFILVKNQLLCCFGQVPRPNEWMMVSAARPVPISADKPITVRGKLKVHQPETDSGENWIYEMREAEVEVMK